MYNRFNGIFKDEKIKSIRYTVISEWGSIYKVGPDDRYFWQSDSIMPLGTFDNMEAAYGRALLHLNEQIKMDSREDCYISPLFELEAETGFGMTIKYEGEDEWTDYGDIYGVPKGIIFCKKNGYDTVFILVDKEYKEDE